MTDEQEQELRAAAVAWQRARDAAKRAWQNDEARAIIAGTAVCEQAGDGKFTRTWAAVECTPALLRAAAAAETACVKLLFAAFPVPPDEAPAPVEAPPAGEEGQP